MPQSTPYQARNGFLEESVVKWRHGADAHWSGKDEAGDAGYDRSHVCAREPVNPRALLARSNLVHIDLNRLHTGGAVCRGGDQP